MSNLVVLTFDHTADAAKALETLRGVERDGRVKFNDTAVIVKDANGMVHLQNEVSSATEIATVAGALIGPLLFFLFPIAGVVIGAAGGALVGRLLDMGVDDTFVKDVSEGLKPGSSALFLLIREADPDMVLAALRPYRGHVYQTTLSSEQEESLRHALDDQSTER